MTDFDVLSDVFFKAAAESSVQWIEKDCEGHPVDPSQIHGLRQIARAQPRRVEGFAIHQKERAEKRSRPDVAKFWRHVEVLCDSANANHPLAKLAEVAEGQMPERFRGQNLPKAVRRERRQWLEDWQTQWLENWQTMYCPEFFRRFCTHYLYRRSLNKARGR